MSEAKGMDFDMNRFFAAITAVLLCACLVACARTPSVPAPSEPALPEPSSMQEIESMIEPLEVSETPETSSDPVASSAPDDGQSAAGAAQDAPAAPQSTEPKTAESEASASEPELLTSVSAHKKPDTGTIERELLRLVNDERVSAGTEPLGMEDNMLFAARIRAGEAITSFSHTRPNGTPYNTAFDEAGFSYAGKWHGENLASMRFTIGMLDENSVALEIFNSLKNSPGHYRNMVSDNFLQTGVGVAVAVGPNDIDIACAQLFSSL